MNQVIKDIFDFYQPLFIAELNKWCKTQPPQGADYIEFVAHFYPSPSSLPVILHILDEQGYQLGMDHKKRTLTLIEGVSHVTFLKEVKLPERLQELYEQEEIDIPLQDWVEWTMDCWQKADGDNYPLDTFGSAHDSTFFYDFQEKQWRNQELTTQKLSKFELLRLKFRIKRILWLEKLIKLVLK